MLAWGPVSGQEPLSKAFDVRLGTRVLFLDDIGIERLNGLTRKLHQPAKRGAVLRSDHPEQVLQIRTAPIWDPDLGRYRLWVLGLENHLWESRDGLHWSPGPRPNLRTDMVVYDPHDPDPARRYKAPVLNEGFAVSPDGVQWTKLDLPKVESSDEGNFSFDATDRLFIHTVKRRGPNGRSLAIATSRNFRTWQDLGVVFHADDEDQKRGRAAIEARAADATLHQTRYRDPAAYNVDVYNMGVFRYEGLYIGLPAMYHATGPVPNYPNTDGFHLVQVACSRDLKSWTRVGDRQPFLAPSRRDSGAYDLTQILPPSAPVVRGEELWFYYTGLKYRAAWTYSGTYPNGRYIPLPGLDRDAGAVCLAVLRRDGFVSLNAGETPGTVLTKPFLLPQGRLHVNLAAPEGSLRVALCDAQGEPLPDLPESDELVGDRTSFPIPGRWEALQGRTVRLRFTLRRGDLYAYWFAR